MIVSLHKDFPLLTPGAHLWTEYAADYRLPQFYLIYYLQVLIFSLVLPSFQVRKYKPGITIHSEKSHNSFLLCVLFVAP